MTYPDGVCWITEQLDGVPAEADAALILRHAEREDIPPGTFGVDVPLTAYGVESAERLGAMLSGLRPQAGVTASAVPRCVSTGRAILRGGGWSEGVALDWRLGDPGPFVVDEEVSGARFLEIGILEIVRHQLTHVEPPAGMRETSEGVDLLLGLTANGQRPTVLRTPEHLCDPRCHTGSPSCLSVQAIGRRDQMARLPGCAAAVAMRGTTPLHLERTRAEFLPTRRLA